MIDKDTLVALARAMGMRPWQQEKHYVQCLVLNAVSDLPIVFKGDACLWMFHDLQRFSEDLDFTSEGSLPATFARQISRDVAFFGVENMVKTMQDSDTSLSLRISAKGPLNTSDKDLCHVYVEISKREPVLKEKTPRSLDMPAYGMPIRVLSCMALDEIAAEKTRAILTRDKARDVYDLWFLITRKRARFDENCVREKLRTYGIEFSAEHFIEALKKKAPRFTRELKPLVFGKLPEFDACLDVLSEWPP